MVMVAVIAVGRASACGGGGWRKRRLKICGEREGEKGMTDG